MSKQQTARTATPTTALGAALLKALPDGKLLHPTVETAMFKKVADFTITVQDNWNHGTSIGDFIAEFENKTFVCDPKMTDANFAGVAYGLIRGCKYRARVYQHNGATSLECVWYLAKLGAIFVGAQGLVHVASQKAHELLWKRQGAVVSFGEAVPCEGFVAPFMSRSEFNLASLDCTWPANYAMLCITRIA